MVLVFDEMYETPICMDVSTRKAFINKMIDEIIDKYPFLDYAYELYTYCKIVRLKVYKVKE